MERILIANSLKLYKLVIIIISLITLLGSAHSSRSKCHPEPHRESRLPKNVSYPDIHVVKLVPLFTSRSPDTDDDTKHHTPAMKNWTELEKGKIVVPSFLELFRLECIANYRVQWGFQSYPWITWDTWTTAIRPSEGAPSTYSSTIEFHKMQETSLQTRIPICFAAHDPCIQTAVIARSGLSNTVEITFQKGSSYGIDSQSEKDQFGENRNCTLRFGYDKKTQRFYCQETDKVNTTTAGKIFLRSCADPVSCESLISESNCTATKPLIPISECTIKNRCRQETAFAGKFPGIAVCHTGGNLPEHSAAIMYFPSLASYNSTTNITKRYLHWGDAIPSEMLQLPEFHGPLYTYQKLTLTCNASYFYLGSGMYFTLTKIVSAYEDTLTDGTTEAATSEESFEESELDEAKESIKYDEANINGIGSKLPVIRSLEVSDFEFSSSGTYELACIAPVWNSTEWARKSVKVMVKESIIPEFEGGNMTERQYYTPFKRLQCMAYGVPKPDLTWTRDGGTVPEEISLITGEQNQTLVWAILVFPKLEFGVNGNFTCTATNVAGTATKTYIIIPPDKTSSTALTVLVSLGLLISVLIPFVLFLMWKVRHQRSVINDLTQEEVDEFMNGKPEYIPFQCDMSTYAYYLPYDTKFEISRDSLEIDFEKILGSGEYGLVLYGLYKNANPPGGGVPSVRSVAVKTTKPLTDGKEYFKALLSELKIMTYIGNHNNVVNLIGACTKNIKKREVFIATEYCENGSLLAYLRMNRYAAENPCFYAELAHPSRLSSSLSMTEETSFSNPLPVIGSEKIGTGSDIQYVKMEDLGNLAINPHYEGIRNIKQQSLLQWSYEIAKGMEFLASRKVIHGDLAARNVLLTRDLTAKICDFGLSRQLYHYNYYTKTAATPLPLKWLAIESLQNFQFSIESDVWAYAVTLFEVFSLGEIPYSSIQMNGEEFLRALKHGMRLNRPNFASVEIFELMMKCWRHDRKQRPTFPDIAKFFELRLPHNNSSTESEFDLEKEKESLPTKYSKVSSLKDDESSEDSKLECELSKTTKNRYANVPTISESDDENI